jgi:hypothetical protein
LCPGEAPAFRPGVSVDLVKPPPVMSSGRDERP